MSNPAESMPMAIPRPHFRRAASLAAVAAAGLAIACAEAPRLSRAPNIIAGAVTDPFKWAMDDQRSNTARILYATDRTPIRKDSGTINYGSDRSRSLSFGECEVEFGKNLPWQTLMELTTAVNPSTSLPLSIKSIRPTGAFPETPMLLTRTDGVLTIEPEALKSQKAAEDAFRAEVADRLSHGPIKEAFVFIHGYNNSFSSAAVVMAEIWHFLGRRGVPIVYSWPAGVGGMRGYTHDRESGEFTNYHLKEFLKTLASTPGLEKIHLISHSRGTDVITTALRELFLEARAGGKDPKDVFRIANLVLAAPDMDFDVVTQRVNAERIPAGIGRVTVYVSSYDRALGISDWLFMGVRRLGQLRNTDLTRQMHENMQQTDNVDVINVGDKTDFVGHSYFHTNPGVSADLVLMLRDNLDAGAAHGRPLTPLSPHFWQLNSNYPNK